MYHRLLPPLVAGFAFAPLLFAQAPGALDTGFDPNVSSASAIVMGLAVQPDGRIVLVGGFSTVGGQARAQIARVGADGSFEGTSTFNPGTGPNAQATNVVVQPDGKLLLGGNFASINGQTRPRIGRLLEDGSVEGTGTFNVGTGANNVVSCVARQPDGRFLVSGAFSSINGTGRTFLARLNADGTLDSAFNPALLPVSGRVNAVAVQADGKIVLGGLFASVNGQTRTNLARLNTDGSLEGTGTFNPGTGPNNEIQTLVVQPDGKILVGGFFTSFSGSTRNSVARLNADGTLESTTTFNPGTGANAGVVSIALQTDGKILLGGFFSTLNAQPRNRVARLNSDGTLDSFNVGTGPNNDVQTIALQADGKLLVGGQFTTWGGTGSTRNRVARLANDAATQSLTVPSVSRIQWDRGGASPEVEQVTFDLSIDGGASWTPLGAGSRTATGWERTGLSLPSSSGLVRARGRATGGFSNGSASLFQATAPLPFPSIALEQPAGSGLASGGARAFPTTVEGKTNSLTFTVRNIGGGDLTGLGLSFSGANAALCSVTNAPVSPVVPGGSTTFTVRFAPTSGGLKTALLTIASNDAGQPNFTVNLSGQALSYSQDSDNDGLNDAAEFELSALGFDWQVAQPTLVATLFNNAGGAGLYTTSQVQQLNVGVPLVARDPGTGLFTLTIGLMKSTDLQSFTPFPFVAPQTSVNGQGQLQFQFSAPDNAAFFRLQSP